MSYLLETAYGGPRPDEASDTPRPLPIGFGRGRRGSQVMVLHSASSTGQPIPRLIPQWGPDVGFSDFWVRLLSGLGSGTGETGFAFVWRPWREGESCADLARALPAYDGVVVFSPRQRHRPLVDMLADLGIPAVLAWARHPDPRYPSVNCDNGGGVTQAVHHLSRLGHTRIGYLSGSPIIAAFGERRQAYYSAMASAGLDVDPRWVAECGQDYDEANTRAVISGLLGRADRPSALICFNDNTALLVIEQAREMGLRVPDDLAVVGFDDVEEALQVIPHLTTVRQPIRDIASLSFHLLACCIEGQQPSTGSWQVEVPVTLVIRESCGAAPSPGASPDSEGPHSVRQELEWRMRQLAAVNQEMQELLHAASHDLRSPLITIQGFVSTLERKYHDRLDEQGRHYLDRIGRSVESMEGLIGSLLTLSRAHTRPLDSQPVSLHEVVERVRVDLQGIITEKRAHLRLKRRLPTVFADENALYQVFLNLIGNALKYMGDQPAPLITIGHHAWPEEHEFTVQDNGIGIAPEHHEEVFQAFRRVAAVPVEGAGIGLAIVKRIILRHGGRIWVDSQPGQGAAFRFTLPRRDVNYDGLDTDPGHGQSRDGRFEI